MHKDVGMEKAEVGKGWGTDLEPWGHLPVCCG